MQQNIFFNTLKLLSSAVDKKKVCIIGSGPAGFYFAQHLIKVYPNVLVDIYEELPVPFGLIRYGVAPDHPEVKNVINTFTKTAQLGNVRFVGNVSLGKDVSFKQFQNAYNAVVLTYGCSEDRKLGIKGEDLPNVYSAREFVGWYNGLPSASSLSPDLSTESAIVLGQGNVAIDVARILLSPVDLLKKTDIPESCLEALSRNKVKRVHLVGRRGPLQASFTIKEFREMTKLPGVVTKFNINLSHLNQYLSDLPRPRKRLTELLIKTAESAQTGNREFHSVFYRRPVEIVGSKKPESVVFSITSTSHPTKEEVEDSGASASLECGLILRSIGYKGTCPDPDIPWLPKTGCVSTLQGVYGAGWISSGPVGVILTTMSNAFQQADCLANDLRNDSLCPADTKHGYPFIKNILETKGIKTISFEGWQRIDKEEVERGMKLGKPREKITSIQEMLNIGAD